MPELSAWPYAEMPHAYDESRGGKRYLAQKTEDGYYGFVFVGASRVASMVGPYDTVTECVRELTRLIPPK